LPDFSGDAAVQRSAFSKHLLTHEAGGSPGEYLYSNAGYAIAAAMLEQAGGSSYAQLMQDKLLAPLGMTGHWGWPLGAGTQQPWGHSAALFGLQPHDPADGYEIDEFVDPAGDLSVSIGDYAKFVQAHLRGLRGREPSAGFTSLTAEIINELHLPAEDYACGWGIQEYDGVPASVHEGSAGTFHAITVIVPERDIAVVTITNAGGDKPARAIRDLLFELLEEAAR
jgi:CubicO group peptidase (beta-lactamase class C family)